MAIQKVYPFVFGETVLYGRKGVGDYPLKPRTTTWWRDQVMTSQAQTEEEATLTVEKLVEMQERVKAMEARQRDIQRGFYAYARELLDSEICGRFQIDDAPPPKRYPGWHPKSRSRIEAEMAGFGP